MKYLDQLKEIEVFFFNIFNVLGKNILVVMIGMTILMMKRRPLVENFVFRSEMRSTV